MKKTIFLILFCGAVFTNAKIFDNELELCEKGDMKSCNFIINCYEKEQDKHRQMWDLIGKLCLNGDDEKCEIIRKHPIEKVEILEKSCDNKNIKNCKKLSEFYYSHSEESKLLSIYERLCEFGEFENCALLGEFYMQNDFYVQNNDITKGLNLLQTACDKGHKDSCNAFINLKFANVDNSENLDFLDKECDKEIASACLIMANFYEEKRRNIDGREVELRIEYSKKALPYYVKGCKFGKFQDFTTIQACSGYEWKVKVEKLDE